MQLSLNPKTFSDIFSHFSNLDEILNILKKRWSSSKKTWIDWYYKKIENKRRTVDPRTTGIEEWNERDQRKPKSNEKKL